MNIHYATEVAYRNGYKAGYQAGVKEFEEKLKYYHKNYEGYCVVDDDDIDDLVEEMTEGRENG
jgi:hypothetical protein